MDAKEIQKTIDDFLNSEDGLKIIDDKNLLNGILIKDIYKFLNIKRDYTSWRNELVKKFNIIESIDYIPIRRLLPQSGGVPCFDFIISFDKALKIVLSQNNTKSIELIDFFISKLKEEDKQEIFNKIIDQK